MSEIKTNAMRILEQNKIPYTVYTYRCGKEPPDGLTVASLIEKKPEIVFKTLVTAGSDNYFVFVLPVGKELDLKKAAKAAGVKSVEMIPVKDINKVTGYVRGGCSPVGMKKAYRTFFAAECENYEKIIVSGGKIGIQMEIFVSDLLKITEGCVSEITFRTI